MKLYFHNYTFIMGNMQIFQVLPINLDPGERHSHAVCQWNDLILVSGGLNSDLRPLNSIYAFNTNTYEWTKIEVTGILHERYDFMLYCYAWYFLDSRN